MKLLLINFSISIAISLVCHNLNYAQTTINGKTVEGVWKTIDDNTGKAKSHVTIFQKNGVYYGKVTKILDPSRQDRVCEKCDEDDPRFNKKILGMEIIQGMKKKNSKYADGNILDPEKGSVYTCTMWLESEKTLKVRGWVAFLFRTQTWHRVQ